MTNSYKRTVEKLKDSDPSFFKFLQEEDADLLDLDASSDEGEDGERSERDGLDHDEAEARMLAASSDSEQEMDGEEDDESVPVSRGKDKGPRTLTIAHVNKYSQLLQDSSGASVCGQVVDAFAAAVHCMGVTDVQTNDTVIKDAQVFNGVVRLCFVDLSACLLRLVRPSNTEEAKRTDTVKEKKKHKHTKKDKDSHEEQRTGLSTRMRKWTVYRTHIRKYITLLAKLLPVLSDEDVLLATLRHTVKMILFVAEFSKLSRLMLKCFVRVWSRGSSACRVQAYLCIDSLTRHVPSLYSSALKQLYLSYVRNSKVVTESSLPAINFMQCSFAELVQSQPDLAYPYVFVYIRQMAIHVRNASICKKQEQLHAVHNWQFLNCVYLWCRVLSVCCLRHKQTNHKPTQLQLQPIIELCFPLNQLIFACARLASSSRFVPLRIQCVRALMRLNAHAPHPYTPVMNMIAQMLDLEMFSKRGGRGTALSQKPLKKTGKRQQQRAQEQGTGEQSLLTDYHQLRCHVRVSKAVSVSALYIATVSAVLHQLLLKALATHAHSLGFVHAVLPVKHKLKEFVRKCKQPDMNEPFKELLGKVTEHCDWLQNKLDTITLSLADYDQTLRLESELAGCQDSPLGTYYACWQKMQQRQSTIKHDADLDQVPVKSAKVDKQRKVSENGHAAKHSAAKSDWRLNLEQLLPGPNDGQDDQLMDLMLSDDDD